MKLHAITIDCSNPQSLAAWWAEALGLPIAADYGQIVQLSTSVDLPPIQFQGLADIPTQRNRVHLDLRTTDLETDAARLVSLGASLVQTTDLPQIRYSTLLDPEGNIFDLVFAP